MKISLHVLVSDWLRGKYRDLLSVEQSTESGYWVIGYDSGAVGWELSLWPQGFIFGDYVEIGIGGGKIYASDPEFFDKLEKAITDHTKGIL